MFITIRQISVMAVCASLLTLITACGGGGGAGSGSSGTTVTYSVNVTVSGLAGSGLVLQNNAGNNLAIAANGSFGFSTTLADAVVTM